MDEERNRRDGRGRSVPLRLVAAIILVGIGIPAVVALSDWLGADRLGRPWDRAVRGAGFVAVCLAAAAVFPRRGAG